ncbi:hypothetical protein THAOC_31996, partial [Thalassiosira oceanica]
MAYDVNIPFPPPNGDGLGGSFAFTSTPALRRFYDPTGLPTFSSSHTACRQAGAFGPIAGSPFTLRMCLAEDMGSPLRFGRPPGTLDPGDGCPTDRPLQWLPDQSGRPASSPYQYAACNQAGALGPIADRPFTLRTYLEEDLG